MVLHTLCVERNASALCSTLVGAQEPKTDASHFREGRPGTAGFSRWGRDFSWLHRLAVNVALDWLRGRLAHEAKLTVPLPDLSDEETSGALTDAA